MIDHMIQETDQYDILIVDDSRDSLELLNRILETRGYRVRLATNGRLALNSVAAKLPDLILLDVKMPEMDGYEVCRRLKSAPNSRNVPVIFISALGETTQKVEGFKAGGVDYIAKPFERAEVLARVESHLRLYELTEHLEKQVDQRTRELRREIAEHRRTEKILQEKEYIIESASSVIATYDFEGGMTYVNPAFLKTWGFEDTHGVYGRPFWEFWMVEDRLDEIMTTMKSGKPWSDEIEARKKDGTRFHVHVLAAMVFDKAGESVGFMSTSVDITGRKRAEEELHRLNLELDRRVLERTAQLEAANKELEGFTYSVSHDLRAPLRHIDGFMELLQKKLGTDLDEQGRHYMAAISGSSRRMGNLIDDLLDFSRMGRHALSTRPVELHALALEVIQELESETDGRDIDWCTGDLPVVNGDRAMLRIVLANLIANAVKFTRQRAMAKIEIGCLPSEKTETVVFVRDNGVGFDMTYGDKLFGVFQRLHRQEEFEGTGIGLANVRRIINRHGGRTWAEGKVDQGATFYFSLPLTGQERVALPAPDTKGE
jgi:PAS domain S-box-containing protein